MEKTHVFQILESRIHTKKLARTFTQSNNKATALSLRCICEIAREIGCDTELADQLYAAQNVNANLLATLIDDPESYTPDQMENRIRQTNKSLCAGQFCKRILARSPYAVEQVYYWLQNNTENSRYCALMTLSSLANQRLNLSNVFFDKQLKLLSKKIKKDSPLVHAAYAKAEKRINRRKRKSQLLYKGRNAKA